MPAQPSGTGDEWAARTVDVEPIRPAGVDRALVAKVVRVVDLLNVRLDWCLAGVNCLYEEVPPDWHEDAEVHFDAHYGKPLDDGDRFSAWAALNLAWNRPEEEREPDIGDIDDVEVNAFFEVSYRLADRSGIDDTALAHFCAFNAAFNAWPYWREFLQATTARLGLTPFVIGVLRVPDLTSRGETDSG